MAFIESFTRPFMLAVMLWPFLSFVLTLPVLALLYQSGQPTSGSRRR